MFRLPGGITRCCPNPMIAASTARDNNVSGGYPLLFSSFTFVVEEEGSFSVLCLLLFLWCVLDVAPDVDWLLSSSFGVAYNVQQVLLVFGSTVGPKLRKIRILSFYRKCRFDFIGWLPIPNSLIFLPMSCFLLLERHPPVCLLLLSMKWRLASTRVSNKQPIGLREWPIQPSQDFTLVAGMETPPLASTPSEIFPKQHSSLTCFSP